MADNTKNDRERGQDMGQETDAQRKERERKERERAQGGDMGNMGMGDDDMDR